MKEKTCKSVRLSYGIIFGAFTLVVGALFIWQVLDVYITGTAEGFQGAHPFSRERVLEALSKIDLFFWLWIAGIIVGFVLWEVFPVKEKPRKICPDLQYARLMKRFPSAACAKKQTGASKYVINASYDKKENTLSGTADFTFYNSTGNEISDLQFNLWGNAYREGAKYKPVSEALSSKAYYAGASYGGEELEELECTHYTYDYEGDKLKAYNNETFAYNALGNPTMYRGKTANWLYGKLLANYNGVTFSYNGAGQRGLRADGLRPPRP